MPWKELFLQGNEMSLSLAEMPHGVLRLAALFSADLAVIAKSEAHIVFVAH
jgi:hypothetical protein